MQIAKSQDRDAANNVAGRTPGVTVIENLFMVVRGLTECVTSAIPIRWAIKPASILTSRSSRLKQFSHPETSTSVTGLKIGEDTKGFDSDNASNFLRAYYGMVML